MELAAPRKENQYFLAFLQTFLQGLVIVQLLQEGPKDLVLAFVFGFRNCRGVYRRGNHTEGTKSLGFGEKGMSDR